MGECFDAKTTIFDARFTICVAQSKVCVAQMIDDSFSDAEIRVCVAGFTIFDALSEVFVAQAKACTVVGHSPQTKNCPPHLKRDRQF